MPDDPLHQLCILIDGSSYLYRAFHALPDLRNSRGEPTGAIYGVLGMIRKLLSDYHPDYIAIIFDPKGKTPRHLHYPQYKANRPTMPDTLRSQIPILFEAINAMGLPLLQYNDIRTLQNAADLHTPVPQDESCGIEADDVIATVATRTARQNIPVYIATGDKDMAQLVGQNIWLLNTMTDTRLDSDAVMQKYGVPPRLIVDYLSLVGDTSDNIPGVPKVGPKTAAKWLHTYQSLDSLVAHAADIPGKVGANLRASLANLQLAKQLVTLHTDLKIDYKLESLCPQKPRVAHLDALYGRLAFRNWQAALPKEHTAPTQPVDYHTILTESALDDWMDQLKKAKQFALDTETTSLKIQTAELVGISLALAPGYAAYIPLAHNYLGAPCQLPRSQVLAKLQPILADSRKTVIGQNLKHAIRVLANYGVHIAANIADTRLESYVIDNTASKKDLASLSLKHLGKSCTPFESIAGSGKNQLSFNQIPMAQAAPYAAQDADFSLQLHQYFESQLVKNPVLKKVLYRLDLPLIPVLARMEQRGVLVDATRLSHQSHVLAKQLQVLQDKAFELAGTPFNLASPKQLQDVLYNQLGLPILAKTPKGQPATSEQVLQRLALNHPLPGVILAHRGLSKLKSTYTDSLPKQICAKTGRIHTTYHPATTSTGRLSSSDPNLQNIPIKTEAGQKIRQAFVAPSGYCLVSADYSQIELRLMAHFCQDPGLLRAFREQDDVHTRTASDVFQVPVSEVTAKLRRSAKAINFGLIYGMSAFGLARQLDIAQSLAKSYIARYFVRYSGVRNYMENTKATAQKQGYVETLSGRRLYIPNINSQNTSRRTAAERVAINAPIQGTAADLIKLAMIRLDTLLLKKAFDAKIILQVHDELVFEVKQEHVDALLPIIEKTMTDVFTLSVPLVVHIHAGNNWDRAHGLG